MKTDKQIISKPQHSYDEKLKAAYALNMCTVSVSQIVDYNDVYVLEQEYDTILNNLNLKQMPKDEALLRIISELLNTITFFRIQEIKKNQIDKKYRQRLKNAIWSAVPNLSVVVSGNPVAIALSLATQIGSGYMNYRKEKVHAASDKDDSEIELQITAIEQLNALRRELFTTAWRLADEYDFDDEWRLSEKQITQYNAILQDPDEFRKYARLEAVSDRFIAYPPFWYFYGHTANYIAEMARNEMNDNLMETDEDKTQYYKSAAVVKTYTELAKSHFEEYYKLCNNNILREDQLTANFAIEYADILWNDEARDLEKIHALLKLAEKMTPNSFDILQLCSISYLKIGSTDDAARILKILVNENYNAIANAKLLSKLYVSKYISTGDSLSLSNYEILEQQVDSLYLYPMPDRLGEVKENIQLDYNFMAKQKAILKKAYRNTMDAYAKKLIVEFNAVLPAARNSIGDRELYFGYTDAAKKRRINDVKKLFENERTKEGYILSLKDRGFRHGYIGILNQTISELETLSCFRNMKVHDQLIKIIEAKIRNAKLGLTEIQTRIDDGSFSFEDYLELIKNYSYQYFTEKFFDELKKKISDNIESLNDMSDLDTYDFELIDFCDRNGLPAPEEYLHTFRGNDFSATSTADQVFFGCELIGIDGNESDYSADSVKKMLEIIKQNLDGLILNPENVSLYLCGDNEFEVYFQNNNLKVLSDSIYLHKQKAFAILDDKTQKDYDLIFCVDGITPVSKNTIRDTVDYGVIVFSANGNKSELMLGYTDVYSSKDVDLFKIKSIAGKMNEYLSAIY